MPVDPTKVTNYNLDAHGLEEVILFWVCAAGKNGVSAARALDRLLCSIASASPFGKIRALAHAGCLPEAMRAAGIGCWRNKSRTFTALATSGIDLRNCSLKELEAIPGIGPKTSRCFAMHSRAGFRCAGLDVHMLRFLGDCGFDAPKSSPSKTKYAELERAFLLICDLFSVQPSDLDLTVWNVYSFRDQSGASVARIDNIAIRMRSLNSGKAAKGQSSLVHVP